MLSKPLTAAPLADRVLYAALVALLMAGGGCRSLCKQPVSENVVEARQISLRGMEAMQQGKDEEAERLFAKAIETCPVDERARRHYADLLWKRGEHAQAARQMEEAVRLSGGDAGLLVQLGQMQLARGDVDAARKYAQRAVDVDRKLASAWALLGDTQRAAHDVEQALASYHRALSHDEFFPHVQLAVADIYRRQGKPQRALATLTALEDCYSAGQAPAEVLLAQGLTLKQLGRYDDATRTLTAAIARGATSTDTFYELAEAQWQNGDAVNARLSLAAALEQTPGHARSLQLSQALQDSAPGGTTLR